MGTNWFLPLALIFEAGGVFALTSDLSQVERLSGYLAGHALACLALTFVLLPLLPARYRGAPLRAGSFLFTLQFAVPFLGSLGVFTGVLLALYLPRSSREIPWQEIALPELPYQPVDMDRQIIYSEGGLRQVLRDAATPDKRLEALLATRQMSGPEAVEILREALRDPVDDVRLLAYSMLEQKEKRLVTEAGRLQTALQGKRESDWETLSRRLAQIWWEIAYLGLAQGSLRLHYLHSARGVLQAMVVEHSRHNDWRLLGRVELALGDTALAEQAFEAALTEGASAHVVYPYMAEVAFLRRDFDKVRYYLARCAHGTSHGALRPLLEAWL